MILLLQQLLDPWYGRPPTLLVVFAEGAELFCGLGGNVLALRVFLEDRDIATDPVRGVNTHQISKSYAYQCACSRPLGLPSSDRPRCSIGAKEATK